MVVRTRAGRLRRGARPAAVLAALGAIFGLAASLPSDGAAALTQIVVPAFVAPAPCPGCKDFVLNLPATPTTDSFGDDSNSTEDVVITFPAGWASLTCGDDYGVFARTNGETGGGMPVAGWRCTSTLNTLRFQGPTADSIEDSGQRFLFRALTTGPLNGSEPVEVLNAGFIDIVQTYQDGEQQKRRAVKQLQARRPANLGTAVRLDLPADWRARCVEPSAAATANAIPVDRSCSTTPGTGDHPKFRIEWAAGDPARFFYFEAWTLIDPVPASLPPDLVNVNQLRDMMFEDGEINTELVTYLRPGTPFVQASPRPTVTISPRPQVQCNPAGGQVGSNNDNGFNNGFNNGNGNTEIEFRDNQGNQRNPDGSLNLGLNNNPGYTYPGDPCAPPVVVLDPCSGEIFSKEGPSRFAPEDRVLPPGCAYPGSGTGPMPKVDPIVMHHQNGQACIPRPAMQSQAAPPPGDRASRSYRRPALPGADPTPPVVMISPEDGGSVQRAPGSTDDRVIVAPPNANPEPSIRALLPNGQEAPAVIPPPAVEGHQVPYCDDVALPDTGGSKLPMRIAFMVLGLGAALTAGAVYWRRNAPRGLRYTRS